MGKSEIEYKKIIFEIEPDYTNVEVHVKWHGEILMGTKSVYKKHFPKHISIKDILEKEVPSCITWD